MMDHALKLYACKGLSSFVFQPEHLIRAVHPFIQLFIHSLLCDTFQKRLCLLRYGKEV